MYRPLEYSAGSDLEFDGMDSHPRNNPGRRKRLPAEFKGLRVKIALVRDPDYNSREAFVINNPGDVAELMRGADTDVAECIYAVLMNVKNRVVGVYEVARGSVASVRITPADVLRAVLAAGTSRFILVHNHPSGEPYPSLEDNVLTQTISGASKVIGMSMLDHVIVAADGHYAYSASNPAALK